MSESDPVTEAVPVESWWRRLPLAAGTLALAIGMGGIWYADMLQRVPLDKQSAFGFVLMLPFLLIVPAFSAAGLRLAWLSYSRREISVKFLVVALAVSAAGANWIALAGFVRALARIFGLWP
ncbi:MAG: hypothetical protein ACKVP2_11370 [Burkholderiales bacterium]